MTETGHRKGMKWQSERIRGSRYEPMRKIRKIHNCSILWIRALTKLCIRHCIKVETESRGKKLTKRNWLNGIICLPLIERRKFRSTINRFLNKRFIMIKNLEMIRIISDKLKKQKWRDRRCENSQIVQILTDSKTF